MFCTIRAVDKLIDPVRAFADKVASPFLYLFIRLYMAQIFFQSGMLKFENYLNDDWQSTVDQFVNLFPVPGIPAPIAAVMGTSGELGLSALLALGLCGRFAAIGLMGMTCVIQFLVPPEYEIANPEHYYWLMLLAVIAVRGPGLISLDHMIRHHLSGCYKNTRTSN